MKFKILNILFIFILVTAVFAGTGVTEDIPIDKGIAGTTSYGFPWELDDADLANFQDTYIRFQGKDYDIHEVLVFAKDSPYLATSLTSPDDDYESNIFMEVYEDSIKYYYVFDEAIRVADATMDEPLEIKFLGKTLKIKSVNLSGDGFTAFTGNEYFMKVGDIITIDSKKIVLENVGSGGAVQVSVGGIQEVIPSRVAEFVNGIEIFNLVTFYEDTMSERAAVLIIGNPATVTYKDGDAYIGEDKDDPKWVWDIGNLNTKEPTVIFESLTGHQGPYIGIENDFTKVSDSDNPPSIGECINLPNNYAEICFNSLTVPDDQYSTLVIEYKPNVNTERSGHERGLTKAQTIHIYTPQAETLEIPSGVLDTEKIPLPFKTNEIWLQHVGTVDESLVDVYARDYDLSMKYVGMAYLFVDPSIGGTGILEEKEFLRVNYQNTKENNIKFIASSEYSDLQLPDYSNIKVDINGDYTDLLSDGTDDLMIKFGHIPLFDGSGKLVSSEITSLGTTVSLAEPEELSWYGSKYNYQYNIGTKDEDHRTKYGIIIRDPKSNGASDQVVLEIPADQVQAIVTVNEKAVIHDVRITGFDISPQILDYNETANIELGIVNYGTETEFNVYTRVLNTELGIDKQSDTFNLAPSDTIVIKETITIPDNAEEKAYSIEAIVYFDNGKEQETKFNTIVVENRKDLDLTVDILNPTNDSIINTNSVWLNVNTNRNSVCSYTLKTCNLIVESGDPEPVEVDCSVYESMTCQEIIDYDNDILNIPYARCECNEIVSQCGFACPSPRPSYAVGCKVNAVPINISTLNGLLHSTLIENLLDSWSKDTKVESTLIVTCTDSSNKFNSNSIEFTVDITKEGITDYIHLSEGWNLFSIPLTLPLVELPEENPEVKPIDIRINDIKDKVEAIYSYEQGAWKVWRKDYLGTNTLTDLEAGKGCFIKMNEPATLHIEGTIGLGEPPVIPTFNVYEGWNLIGYYGTKDVSVLTALNNIDGKYSAIWTLFDNGVQSLQGTFRGLEYNEQLKRKHGYWLYAKEDGVIVPTN